MFLVLAGFLGLSGCLVFPVADDGTMPNNPVIVVPEPIYPVYPIYPVVPFYPRHDDRHDPRR